MSDAANDDDTGDLQRALKLSMLPQEASAVASAGCIGQWGCMGMMFGVGRTRKQLC